MKLIKYQPPKDNTNGVSPRWIYETENSIIKTIPYFPHIPDQDESMIQKQIDLINKVCGFDLIINYRLEEKSETWKDNNNESHNRYITYQMEKLKYSYSTDNQRRNDTDLRDPKIKKIDGILKYILPIYLDVALKIFPYGNFDLASANIMMRDNGDTCLIDWDDCLLGHQHTSDTIGNHIIRECVKANNTHIDDIDKKEIKDVLMKTIDVYKKLTYNTKLSEFQIDIDETVNYLYDRWVEILKREGRL
tara:strand:+ start:1744 stop:2487 length:744 start_codon:yes stop_codon:yes gene_type:complete